MINLASASTVKELFQINLYSAKILLNKSIIMTGDINLIRLVTNWISKNGPFMEDWREHSPDDYLFLKHNDEIVTDYSLGEVAFRIATQRNASTVSFQPSNFQMTPILVIWDRPDSQIAIQVPNFWGFHTLEDVLRQQRPPVTSWMELLNHAQTDFSHLIFLDSVVTKLEGEAFNSAIAERVIFQLNILNQLADCFDKQGQRTQAGHEIIESFFTGDRAIFSDESSSNKRDFKGEMTFKKPNDDPVFCPFHGKISHRFFRLHFSWPIRHNEPVYIAYIGPKITKR